jgi:hypothetical protein
VQAAHSPWPENTLKLRLRMISLQKSFLFVHIPKTAGNSIQSVLRLKRKGFAFENLAADFRNICEALSGGNITAI